MPEIVYFSTSNNKIMSIEAYKMPLIEMHRKLVFQLNEKRQEILDSFDTKNKLENLSLIENRTKQIQWFRDGIDKVQPFTDFLPGFTKDYEEIRISIENITL